MDAGAELGRNPVKVSTIFSLSMEMSRLTRDGTAEPVSRDQILRHERGQGNSHFSCSAHVQDWQPYLVDPYSCYMCDHTYLTNNRYIRGTIHAVPPRAYRGLGSVVDPRKVSMLF